jgi:hypothetical protein
MIILSSFAEVLMLLKPRKKSIKHSSPITHFTCLHKFHSPLVFLPVPLFSITLIILSSQKKKKFVGFHQIAPSQLINMDESRVIMNRIIPALLTQRLVLALIPSFNFLVTHYLAYFEVGLMFGCG